MSSAPGRTCIPFAFLRPPLPLTCTTNLSLILIHPQGARGGRDPKFSHYHTTETHDQNKPTMQSIIENNDLGELLDIATLADRDFAGQRYAPLPHTHVDIA